ncbi:hypothetical protein CYMTET_8790 [Cymbomonas tetramitiformis]|uniref:Uncharacterized protein n=1 Tax=Cymbomonas tetramitiformis TaxID=36881 RepID=A0AAE0LG51_9CHLO|nr:hypothetical protein CYMTET_8790 [Cymbomonas tetramitiformis]
MIIKELVFEKLKSALKHSKSWLGEPFAGIQSDIWSPKDNKTSYVCSRLSLVVKLEHGKIMEVSPVLGFEEFLENRHTGPAIARSLAGLLKSVDMDMNDSIALPTLDGAANNKRAFKVFKKRVKVALTGSTTGQCAERAAFVLAPVVTTTQTMASASASPQSAKETESSEEEEEDAGDENAEDSDVDQVEANEANGKEFPLQHRCLPASAWKKNNELESVLTVPYEVSQALQGHTGVGLDKGGAEETWEDVHAKGLEADIIQFREVTAEEVERRLLKLDNDTLLSLRMNPGLDTQVQAHLKRASAEEPLAS